MKKLKKWFRYPVSAVSLVILFVISFYSIYKGADYQHQLYAEEISQTGSQFAYNTVFYVKGEGTEWETVFQSLPVCVSVENISAYVDGDRSTSTIQILLPSQEEPKYPMISGSMYDGNTDPIVILGQGLQSLTYKKNGVVYFDIEGEPYRVIGYVGSKESDFFDSRRIVYRNRMGVRLQKVYDMEKGTGLLLKLSSDTEDTDALLEDLLEQKSFQEMSGRIESSGDSILPGNVVVNTDEDEKRTYILLAFLFCMANAVIVSELWLYERQKEIVIRVENGFSHGQIYCIMYRDILRLSFLSSAFVFVLQVFFEMMVQGRIASIGRLCWNLATMLFFTLLLAGVVLIYPMWYLSKKTPQELFSGKGEV